VVQETFLRLCQQNRASVEPHVAEWLYTVCRNRALDVLRKEKRMKPLTSNQAELREAGQPTPPEAAEQKESTSRILGELRALPSDQQEVIRLKFQHGLSYKEISRITGFSGSHVGVLIHRGIQQLRYELRGAPGS
jgi:RNA polymerase sigma-70 factor (ECF subfamily)